MIDFICSSIGKKLVVSLSGLFLIVFLTLHVALNLTALCSREAYEAACAFMDTNILVQIMVPVLALGFIVHILWAINVEFKNWTSRPRASRYLVPCKTKTPWAARNMFVLGLIVLGFLALHFFHFWSKMQLQHFLGREGSNPYDLLVGLFGKWYYCALYVVWFCAVYFHLTHGFWSAFQSIGLTNVKWVSRLQFLAKVYATAIFFAYLSIPIYFYFGFPHN